jgi:hypothetical protein
VAVVVAGVPLLVLSRCWVFAAVFIAMVRKRRRPLERRGDCEKSQQ